MKRLLLAVGLVLLILLVLGFIAPKQYVIERSIVINAPKTHVYEYMNSLEALHGWTAPLFRDSNTVVRYSGTTGTVGASAKWNGGTVITEGLETITKVVPFNRIETEIRRLKPWESLSRGIILLDGQDEESTVQWRFEGHNPFPFNIRHLFTDMDKNLGPVHEMSLAALKTRAEFEYLEERWGIEELGPSIRQYTYNTGINGKKELFGAILAHFQNQYTEKKALEIANSGRIVELEFWEDRSDSIPIRYAYVSPNNLQIADFQYDTLNFTSSISLAVSGGLGELKKARNVMSAYLALRNLRYKHPIETIFTRWEFNEEDSTKWSATIRYGIE